MPHLGRGWSRLTGDRIVNEGQSVLFGLALKVSVTGGDVTVYEGTDALSGRIVGIFEGIANETRPVMFGSAGLKMDRGIYVDFGSNVDEVLVIWDPVGVGWTE